MTLVTRRRALALGLGAVVTRPARAQARTPVDITLVLALGVSQSVIETRWELQKMGYARAFLDPVEMS